MPNNIFNFQVNDIQNKPLSMEKYKGKVLLVVNVASKCGLTPQYEGLTEVYNKYKAQGFEVLGFPANEFLAQEPGDNEEIQNFCSTNYGVNFPMFSKIVVKGEGQHPLYQYLTTTKPVAVKSPESGLEKKLTEIGQARSNSQDILWNFEKFLVGKNGEIIERFNPDMAPTDPTIVAAIEKALNA